ncbi:MAG: 2OG-Fe(II) oxygenase [Cyanobacteria bacterium SBLK]|nr:2OG-Fe(II) oxygenase [Cyanobacteria bacterium SBLK]
MGNSFPLGVPFRFESVKLLWTVENIYSREECEGFISAIEEANPSLATKNPMYRDQDRVIVDNEKIASDLLTRLEKHLPSRIDRFHLVRLNERLRLYRYKTGQKFSPHMDHWYQPSDTELSLLTILVYFNSNFSGGETRFMEQLEAMIIPKPGLVAIFQHKIRHEGCPVLSGTKYALRTDAIYSLDVDIEKSKI